MPPRKRGFIPGVNAALWYLRSYAQDQQEPIERHAAFLRSTGRMRS